MRPMILAVALLAAIGCSRPTAPAPTEAIAEPQAVPASLSLSPSQTAICPTQWNCDITGKWYTTKSACISACAGGSCFLDTNCNGRCICP